MRLLLMVVGTLQLQITAVAPRSVSVVVRVGESALLPCHSSDFSSARAQCDSIHWFRSSGTVVSKGKVEEHLSDRVSLKDDCSLWIHNVTISDVTRYDCRPGDGGDHDTLVYLSTVELTKGGDHDQVTLTCSVNTVDQYLQVHCTTRGGTNRGRPCSTSFSRHTTLPDYHRWYACRVTSQLDNKVRSFTFRSPPTEDTRSLKMTVRAGGHVTLPCEAGMSPGEGVGANWFFTSTPSLPAEVLLSRPPEVNITQEFSLVLEKVTKTDGGLYTCRVNPASEEGSSEVQLSVIGIDTVEDTFGSTQLVCSVSSFQGCGHSVQWLLEGAEDKAQTSNSNCSSTLTVSTPLTSDLRSFSCKVSDLDGGDSLWCNFPSTSCDGAGPVLLDPYWWMYPALAVVLLTVAAAAAAAAAVVVCQRRRHRGDGDEEPAQMEEHHQHTNTDPEDGVCYISVTYTKREATEEKTEAMTHVDDVDGDGDSVTYSAVKTFSSPPDTSPDSGSLYASVSTKR